MNESDSTTNEIIRISELDMGHGLVKTVDARELHERLGLVKPFANWVKQQIARCKFREGRDYAVFNLEVKNPSGGRPAIEYVFTLYAAKHIAMMSGTDKGFEIRDYFIEVEEKYVSQRVIPQPSVFSSEAVTAIVAQMLPSVIAAIAPAVQALLLPLSSAIGEKPGFRTIERHLELLGSAALGIDDLDQVTRGERSSLGRALVKITKAHKVKVLYTNNAQQQRVAIFKVWILDRHFMAEFNRVHNEPKKQLSLFPVPVEKK